MQGNTKWFSFRYTDEEYAVYVRKWPCFCTHCLAKEWDHCQNIAICGPWYRKDIHRSDYWQQSAATYVRSAQQYARVHIARSLDSDANEYEVELIIAKRTTVNTIEYLVKWNGWDETYNEWLTEHDLADSVNLIRRFNRRLA